MENKKLIDVNEPIKATESTINLLKQQNLPTEAHETFLRWLKNFPTVDAVEVVHGRWDHNGNCSACNKNIYDDIDADMWACYEPPYCPNCGARMDLED